MIITAGKFKGQKITAPDENITRPTLSKHVLKGETIRSYENRMSSKI